MNLIQLRLKFYYAKIQLAAWNSSAKENKVIAGNISERTLKPMMQHI
jgi:hypothetical protein